jgi:hypothetical protein
MARHLPKYGLSVSAQITPEELPGASIFLIRENFPVRF